MTVTLTGPDFPPQPTARPQITNISSPRAGNRITPTDHRIMLQAFTKGEMPFYWNTQVSPGLTAGGSPRILLTIPVMESSDRMFPAVLNGRKGFVSAD